MPRNNRLTKEQILEAIELYKTSTTSIRKVADTYNVSFATMDYHFRLNQVVKNPHGGNRNKNPDSKLLCLSCNEIAMYRNGGQILICGKCGKQIQSYCTLKKFRKVYVPKTRKARSPTPTWTGSNAPTKLQAPKAQAVPEAPPTQVDSKLAKAVIPAWLLNRK